MPLPSLRPNAPCFFAAFATVALLRAVHASTGPWKNNLGTRHSTVARHGRDSLGAILAHRTHAPRRPERSNAASDRCHHACRRPCDGGRRAALCAGTIGIPPLPKQHVFSVRHMATPRGARTSRSDRVARCLAALGRTGLGIARRCIDTDRLLRTAVSSG